MIATQTLPAGLPLANNLAFNTVDLDELEVYLESSGLLEKRKLTLLDKGGRVNAHVSHEQLTHLRMVGVHLGANLIAHSVPLRVAQIIIPMRGNILDRTRGKENIAECGRSAILHMPDTPVEVQWQAHTSALVVRIPSDYIKVIYESLTQDKLPNDFQLQPCLDLTRGAGTSILNIVGNLLSLSDNEVGDTQQATLAGLWEELLVTTLLTSDARTSEKISNCKHSVPVYGYVKRTTDYIQNNIRKPLGLDELVEQSGVSIRTLQCGFKKTHGLGPMAFVRQKKLEGIYRELLRNNMTKIKIADLAKQWGFAHASHFARIYKKQFDELPSETLTKNPGNTRVIVRNEMEARVF